MESKKYVARMDEIMRSIYMSEYVIVKHQGIGKIDLYNQVPQPQPQTYQYQPHL